MNAPVKHLPALAPAVSIGDIKTMAEAVAASNLFGIKTPAQAMALMLIAHAEGQHPAVAARDYHIIQGRPALKAEAMLARFQNAGGKVRWTELSDKRVAAVFSHPQGGEIEVDWTIDRAKAAGLAGKDNWKTYPRPMLRSRVISEGIRTVYPGCISGFYTPEEVIDITPTTTVEIATEANFVSEERQQELIAIINTAADEASLSDLWRTAAAECEKAKDRTAYTAIKEAVKLRAQALKQPEAA
jgi:hypothetical protein